MRFYNIKTGLLSIFAIFFIFACDEEPCEYLETITHEVNVPFSIVPTQKTHAVGDTLSIEIFMEDYYSETTNKHYPIRPGDKIFFAIQLSDLEIRREEYVEADIAALDFDIIGDRIEEYSNLTSRVFYTYPWKYDFDLEAVQHELKLAPHKASTYRLNIYYWKKDFPEDIKWEPSCRSNNLLISPQINSSPTERNIDIIANDTNWLENIYGPDFSPSSKDSLLNQENQYIFIVEE